MSKLQDCCEKYSLSVIKIEYCSNYIIIYTEQNTYLFIEEDSLKEDRCKKLKEINFPYYLEYINQADDSYGLYLYYEEDRNSFKGIELVKALTYLHKKTMHVKELTDDEKLSIYQTIQKKIQDVLDYYDNLYDYILSFSFPRIDYYCLIVNYSHIYHSIFQAFYYLDEWYQNTSSIRESYGIQNVSLSNFCFSSKSYFYNLSQCKRDLLIQDFVSFYKNDYDKTNMKDLFLEYQKEIPYLADEISLLFCLLSIPNILLFDSTIYNNTVALNKLLDYLDNVGKFILEENKENQKADKEKFE